MAVDETTARVETEVESEIEMKQPLTAVLKTKDLEIVQECEIPVEQFPDCILLPVSEIKPPRQFFRIGITDRRGFYREGSSYRISQ